MADETPVRSFMDDPNIRWREGKPDFTAANKKYLAEKTKSHKPGSLEKTVENLVKTWEMESTHKVDAKVRIGSPIMRINLWLKTWEMESTHKLDAKVMSEGKLNVGLDMQSKQ